MRIEARKLAVISLLTVGISWFSNAENFDLDIDSDGQTGALTDGLLILRHLFGFSGSTLTDGAVALGASRTSPEAVREYLQVNAAELDIDGDSETDALTDGLLILRYLFGFRGDTLVSAALSGSASRSVPSDIESYLSNRIETIACPIETEGFRLKTGSITWTDYVDGSPNVHKLYPSTADEILTAHLIGGAIDLNNLNFLLSPEDDGGKSPAISLAINSIPAAGSTGTVGISLKLYDGSDAARDQGERVIQTAINVEWESSGTAVQFTTPTQTINLTLVTAGGTAVEGTQNDFGGELLTFRGSGATGATLDLQLASFLTEGGASAGVDLSGHFVVGDYFFQVVLAGFEINDANNAKFTTIQGSFSTDDTPGVAAYVEDVLVTESAGTATVPVSLSRASNDDVSLQYQTEAVTAVAGTDYVTSSGTLTVSAGDTSGNISIDIVGDSNDENPETLILRLTDPVNAALGRSSSEITLVDGPVAACQ
ncbi:MAG: hypothetical protein MK311_12655 [Pseudomonadales bacterium]|nr:hypothetical protein [Pseudomonadales bacterium]